MIKDPAFLSCTENENIRNKIISSMGIVQSLFRKKLELFIDQRSTNQQINHSINQSINYPSNNSIIQSINYSISITMGEMVRKRFVTKS